MKVIFLKCMKPMNKETLAKFKGVQIIDSRFVAGREHIEFAISQAEKAFKRKENFSDSFLMEVLVRASAQRQIKKALEIFGLKDSKEIVLIGERIPSELLKYGCRAKDLKMDAQKYREIKEKFGITETEIGAVSKENLDKAKILEHIIKERIALLPAM